MFEKAPLPGLGRMLARPAPLLVLLYREHIVNGFDPLPENEEHRYEIVKYEVEDARPSLELRRA